MDNFKDFIFLLIVAWIMYLIGPAVLSTLLWGSFLIVIILAILESIKSNSRIKYLREYNFPPSLRKEVSRSYLHLTEEQLDLVEIGLKKYFQLFIESNEKQVISMPSRVIDIAWHTFILHTKLYNNFCMQATGRFIHHTPIEKNKFYETSVKGKYLHHCPTEENELTQESLDGMKNAWLLSCKQENIDPKSPTKLPLLFAIDRDLNIPDGFKHTLETNRNNSDNECGENSKNKEKIYEIHPFAENNQGAKGGDGGCGGCDG